MTADRYAALVAEARAHLERALTCPPAAAEEELALAADCTARASTALGAILAMAERR